MDRHDDYETRADLPEREEAFVDIGPEGFASAPTAGSLVGSLKALEARYAASAGARYIGPDRASPEPRPVTEPTPERPVTKAAAAAVPLVEQALAAPPAPSAPPAPPPEAPPQPARAATAQPAFPVPERLRTRPAPPPPEAPAARRSKPAAEAAQPEPRLRAPAARAEPLARTRAQPPATAPGGGRPPKTPQGGGGGGGGGGNDRGGGVQSRSRDMDFRTVLTTGLAQARRNLVTVALFSFVVNMLVLAIPIYLFQVSDRVLTSRSLDTLAMLTLIVVGAIAAHALLDMMRRLILVRIATEAESKLGAPVLSAAAKAAQNGSSREFQTLSDLQQLRSFITGPVLLTMLDSPTVPLYMLVVFLIHPELGFIVFASSLVLLTLAAINQRMTALSFAKANAYASRANLQADAMARNAQVINAMGMTPEGVAIWGRETAESLTAQVMAQDRNIVLAGISKFLRLCTQVAILGYGAFLALEGTLTGGMIIAASIVASRALQPVEGTIEGWKNFVQARSAYARIRALLQSSPLNLERLRLPRPRGKLEVERILYVPPPNKKVILNGVTFSLEPGESLAIVGNSGTGKSTLARMLVGSIVPTAGNVRLDHMELRNWDPRQFGESVGYLPQDVQLFPGTIKQNIARMREDATDAQVFEAAELADVHEMISHFAQGYETPIAMDGSPLSGGQKQRIGLARAFFGEPRFVVLDEPNSNLDTHGERALAKALVRAKERGITIVAITQRPTLLKSVDKIMILNEGNVKALGPRDQMLPVLFGKKADGSRLPGADATPLIDE
ncbi:type I secretion system permease/ATPase [Salinarimonas sp.]|uniref:type I secretion system permease/ATPase n=1 Tax=Salinarimonas sp. TaxID=2766526 RepID=UPI0032D9100E